LELLIDGIDLASSRLEIRYCTNLYLLSILVYTYVGCVNNSFVLNLVDDELVVSEELV
jgi:hypothetical protein